MTIPPSPLAELLETVREVRLALAYVPQLCSEAKYREAHEVVEEQLVQLAELLPTAERLAGSEGQEVIDGAVRVAGAAAVLVALSAQERGERHPGALSSPGALPRPQPRNGYADQPLF